MSDIGVIARIIVPAAVILLVTAGIAEARGGGGGRSGGGGGRSGGSHSSMSHAGRGAIGWGRGTCRSASCLAKHPTGSFMHPIFPKKRT